MKPNAGRLGGFVPETPRLGVVPGCTLSYMLTEQRFPANTHTARRGNLR